MYCNSIIYIYIYIILTIYTTHYTTYIKYLHRFLFGTGPPPYLDDVNNGRLFFIYILHAASRASILRALRIRKYLLLVKDDIQQKIGEIILMSLVTLIFFR